MLKLLLTLLILANLAEKASSAGASTSSSWFGGLFGKSSDEVDNFDSNEQKESSGIAKEPPPVPRAVEVPRKSKRETLFKKKKNLSYRMVDPYIGDEEIAVYEKKRIERARLLVEQDIRDYAGRDDEASSAGGRGSRRARQEGQYEYDELDGERRDGMIRGVRGPFPDIALRCDPIINFKLKQRITYFGTCVTLGMDYLSDLAQWRAYCGIEDTVLQGRFSLKGKELSWAKSWLVNLGMGEESTAKFKLRLGMNLNDYKAYARLRFRTEPISCFDIGEGLTCAGKLPLPGLLPPLRTVPLRVEYRLRINTPTPKGDGQRSSDASPLRRTPFGWGKKDGVDSDVVSLSTGIDKVEVSLDELNFCLEWDEKSPVWDIGLVRTGDRLRGVFGTQGTKVPVSVSPAPFTSGQESGQETNSRGGGGLWGRKKTSTEEGHSSSSSSRQQRKEEEHTESNGKRIKTPKFSPYRTDRSPWSGLSDQWGE